MAVEIKSNFLEYLSSLAPKDAWKRNLYEKLVREGLPNRKLEDWKYIDFKKLEGINWTGLYGDNPFEIKIGSKDIAFEDLSKFGISYYSSFDLSELDLVQKLDSNPFLVWNILNSRTHFLKFTKNYQQSDVVEIKLSQTDKYLHGFSLVIQIEENVSVNMLENFEVKDASFQSTFIYKDLLPNSQLNYIQNADGFKNTPYFSHHFANVDKNATFNFFTYSGDSSMSRNYVNVELFGEEASADLRGIYIQKDKEFVDHCLKVFHRYKNTKSLQMFKGILKDQSRGVFNGAIYIDQAAPGSDARQLNKTLIFNNQAEMDARPQLEIYADDVKCSHGATVGNISDAELFYLRSRGFPLELATKILGKAFLREVMDVDWIKNSQSLISDQIDLGFDKT